MPIRSAIWKVSPQPLVESSLANETARRKRGHKAETGTFYFLGGTKGSDPFVLFHAGKQLAEAADGRLQQNCP